MIVIDYHITLLLLMGAELGGWLLAYTVQSHPPRNNLKVWRVLFTSANALAIVGVLTYYLPTLRDPAIIMAAFIYMAVNPWFLTNIGYDESVTGTPKGQLYAATLWLCFAIAGAPAISHMLRHGIEYELIFIGISCLASLLITKPAGILHQYQELLMGAQHANKRRHRPSHRHTHRHP